MQSGRGIPGGASRATHRSRQSLYVLRDELDCSGCEFGRLNRERITWMAEAVEKVDKKLNYVLAAAGLQLFGFLLTVVGVLVYRVH